MLVALLAEQHAAGLQVLDQRGVRGLEEVAAHEGDLGQEVPGRVDRHDDGQAVAAADREVLGAERGGLVHQAGAVLGGHVVGEDHVVRVLALRELDQLERPLVRDPLPVAAGGAGEDLDVLPEDGVQQRLGDDERAGCRSLPRNAGHDVGDLRLHGDGGVARQRPRRRRPDQQVGLAGPLTAGDRQPHVHRRVGQRLVALGDLVVGEPRAAAGAVGGHPVVLDQQALVEDLLERPPDALDVGRVHRPVGGGHVDPVAHAVGQFGEVGDVPLDGLAAAGVELRDAVPLDVGLAGEAQLLLDGDLDGQAVAVPACPAGHVPALHGLEPREDVLERARLDVVGAGPPVGGGRALVEDPQRAVRGGLHRPGEDLLGLPPLEDLLLQGGEVDLRGHGSEGAGNAHAVHHPRPALGPGAPPVIRRR